MARSRSSSKTSHNSVRSYSGDPGVRYTVYILGHSDTLVTSHNAVDQVAVCVRLVLKN